MPLTVLVEYQWIDNSSMARRNPTLAVEAGINAEVLEAILDGTRPAGGWGTVPEAKRRCWLSPKNGSSGWVWASIVCTAKTE